MATTLPSSSVTGKLNQRNNSIFEVPRDLFDSCRLLRSPSSSSALPVQIPINVVTNDDFDGDEGSSITNYTRISSADGVKLQRWSCSTCKAEFESLLEQRSHFKSDIHRLNIKLSLAGKGTMKEEDFNETTSASLFEDFDISSISGSEDEDEKESGHVVDAQCRSRNSVNNKLYFQLRTGEIVSMWKCFLLDESENVASENSNPIIVDDEGCYYTEKEVIEKLKYAVHEPRGGTHLRLVLLARGGHFAGCVFDGTTVVAHKTFHRYVIRAKSGKKQSSKDGGGRTIHSAGASLRRYNELALKKDIQELLASWKPYFSASSSVFLHAPSNNRQLFFDGDKPLFFHNPHAIRNIPLTVRRPTFKEALRLYTLVTQVSSVDEETNLSTSTSIKVDRSNENIAKNGHSEPSKSSERGVEGHEANDTTSVDIKKFDNVHISNDSESENGSDVLSTPLHEAAKLGRPQEILDLLEQGVNPCIKDERGRTPYMLAVDKEARNTFRRFMAMNPDKWNWNAAKVPSALTKEMEESQAAKQAEKDAKRKARAKELKKLRKAKEKKAQAEAAKSKNAASNSSNAGQSRSSSSGTFSKEEELKADREKMAAAAERRMASAAALKAQGTGVVSSTADSKVAGASETGCSYCHDSLAGKVPFHRYNYKYCSTTCMHAHREILEDG